LRHPVVGASIQIFLPGPFVLKRHQLIDIGAAIDDFLFVNRYALRIEVNILDTSSAASNAASNAPSNAPSSAASNAFDSAASSALDSAADRYYGDRRYFSCGRRCLCICCWWSKINRGLGYRIGLRSGTCGLGRAFGDVIKTKHVLFPNLVFSEW
jgi:hypothetical protein